ncbi:MAG: SCO family protein [Steroidobacteraceae bacterium]
MTTLQRRLRPKGFFLALGAAGLVAGALIAFFWPRPPDFRLITVPPEPDLSDLRLVDYDGRPRSIADYRSQVIVIYFGYVHCPDTCPTELFKLAQVMKRLGPLSKRVQVLFITLDPERDTPQVLKGYVRAFDPDFIGLTGTTAQIGKAAASFNIQYAKVPAGNDYAVEHSAEIIVLDVPGGRRLIGSPATSIDDFAHDIKQLTR